MKRPIAKSAIIPKGARRPQPTMKGNRMTHLKATLRDTTSMSTSTGELTSLIANLRAVQQEQSTDSGLKGKAAERENARLTAAEDAAYAAIGRYESKNLGEFYQKLSIMFEAVGDQLGEEVAVSLAHNGLVGGASEAELAALVGGVRADAARLLNTSPPGIRAGTMDTAAIGESHASSDNVSSAGNHVDIAHRMTAAKDAYNAHPKATKAHPTEQEEADGAAVYNEYEDLRTGLLELKPKCHADLAIQSQAIVDEWVDHGHPMDDERVVAFLRKLPSWLTKLGTDSADRSVPPLVSELARLGDLWGHGNSDLNDEISQRMDVLEDTLACKPAESLAEAMAQVMIAHSRADCITSHVPESSDSRGLAERQMRDLECALYSVLGILERTSGIDRGLVGGTFYMSRLHDPLHLVDRASLEVKKS